MKARHKRFGLLLVGLAGLGLAGLAITAPKVLGGGPDTAGLVVRVEVGGGADAARGLPLDAGKPPHRLGMPRLRRVRRANKVRHA